MNIQERAEKISGLGQAYALNQFSRNLRRMRDEMGLSQMAVCDFTGIDARSISEYETGIRLPNSFTLLKLCIFFNADMKDFFGGVLNG